MTKRSGRLRNSQGLLLGDASCTRKTTLRQRQNRTAGKDWARKGDRPYGLQTDRTTRFASGTHVLVEQRIPQVVGTVGYLAERPEEVKGEVEV